MRRRATFIQRHDSSFNHNQAELASGRLLIRNLDAAREERLSIPADKLPPAVAQVLKGAVQLQIRWATEQTYDTPAPFSSRLSPGLHILFTSSVSEDTAKNICPLLGRVFGRSVNCSTPAISFTTPDPHAKTQGSPALQFHTLLRSLDNLVEFIQRELCEADEGCWNRASSLLSAVSVDISYDNVSHMVTLSSLWPSPEGGWTEEISRGPEQDEVEVGLFGCENAQDPGELKVGGLLAAVSADEKLKPTLFSFPSRHHSLANNATYNVSFYQPTGLHPTMTISLSQSSLNSPLKPQDASCGLYTYLTLPRTIFGDKYQLSTTDRLFLQSHNLAALHAVSGETDLEAPDWIVPGWGSNWLLELAVPERGPPPDRWNVTIPLHLRYLYPSEAGYRSTAVPWPVVFWACTAVEIADMDVSPFDRVGLGWESLFPPHAIFYQLHPLGTKDGRLVEELQVPVLRLKEGDIIPQSKVIELGTITVISLGLLWILWKLGLVVRTGEGRRIGKEGKEE